MICESQFHTPIIIYYFHSYKYLSAYIPVVSFYYRGKVIYRFKATESYEELLEQITKMTGKREKMNFLFVCLFLLLLLLLFFHTRFRAHSCSTQ